MLHSPPHVHKFIPHIWTTSKTVLHTIYNSIKSVTHHYVSTHAKLRMQSKTQPTGQDWTDGTSHCYSVVNDWTHRAFTCTCDSHPSFSVTAVDTRPPQQGPGERCKTEQSLLTLQLAPKKEETKEEEKKSRDTVATHNWCLKSSHVHVYLDNVI